MAWKLELLKSLHDAGIPFVIIGGVAAIAHGSSRTTEDLDLCTSLEPDISVRIIKALTPAHPRWRPRPDLPVISADNPILQSKLKNMYLRTDWGQLDVLGELPGIGSYEHVCNKVVEMRAFGMQCRVLNIETLIAAKRLAGRDKDMPMIYELEVIREKLQQREKPGGHG
jgi:predicted nucleotidyltransferase